MAFDKRLIKFHGEMPMHAPNIDIVQVVTAKEWSMIMKAIGTKVRLPFGKIGETNEIGQNIETDWILEEHEITTLSVAPLEIEFFLKWFPDGVVGPFDLAELVNSITQDLREVEVIKEE